jgi:hypothetical protein
MLGVVAMCLLGVGWRLTEEDRYFLWEAESTTGEVIEHEPYTREARKVEERYRMLVTFTTPDGDRIRFRTRSTYGRPPYAVGEKVGVKYDPISPMRARVDRKIELLAPVAIWGGSITLLIVVALAMARYGPR